jgi:hypothetical protein
LLGTQDRQLSPIRSFESLKNLPHIFPFKKTKNSLIVIFIPSAYPTEKEKPKSFFPNIFS